MKYHVSPTTGNPNKCYAEKRPCPLKAEDGRPLPHFSTREEALASIEAEAKAAHETFTPLKKKEAAPLPEWAKGESKSFQENLRRYQALLTEPPTLTEAESRELSKTMHEEYLRQLEHHGGGEEEAEYVINQYSGLAYGYLNKLHRGDYSYDAAQDIIDEGEADVGWIDDPDELLEEADRISSGLDDLVGESRAREPRQVRTLYRYQEVNAFADSYRSRRLTPGTVIRDGGYLSTTEDPALLAGVLHKEGEAFKKFSVVYQLVTKEGISCEQNAAGGFAFQAQDFERERVLPRSTAFRVVGVREKEFSVGEDRKAMHRYFDYRGLGSKGEEHVPPQSVMVVELVEEALLQESPS